MWPQLLGALDVNHKLKLLSFSCLPSVVPVTEASVIIAVSSPHREESLEAVTYCINTLKASVPIWKKVCLGTNLILGPCQDP